MESENHGLESLWSILKPPELKIGEKSLFKIWGSKKTILELPFKAEVNSIMTNPKIVVPRPKDLYLGLQNQKNLKRSKFRDFKKI